MLLSSVLTFEKYRKDFLSLVLVVLSHLCFFFTPIGLDRNLGPKRDILYIVDSLNLLKRLGVS